VVRGGDAASATALVGLAGFVVRAQCIYECEHWLLVETSTARSACPDAPRRR
jgi:hypothetical protein